MFEGIKQIERRSIFDGEMDNIRLIGGLTVNDKRGIL